MVLSKINYGIFFFLLLLYINVSAQSGIVSGIIEDESGPLPGVLVTIKGTSQTTTTDFDGNYSIKCNMSDVLVFSFVGMTTREVVVTPDMFEKQTLSTLEKPVEKIISNAYATALKKEIDTLEIVPGIAHTNLIYNRKKGYFNYQRIKKIHQEKDRVKITYFKPDIYYQINYNTVLGIQSVIKNSLPNLQNTYVQGRPNNGKNQWFGPDTNEIFSFGPLANLVAFDGSDYPYDINGKLIDGIAQKQLLPYHNSIFRDVVVNTNNINLKVFNFIHNFSLNARRKTQNDPFGHRKNHLSKFDIHYKFRDIFTAFIKTGNERNNQPNTNGFYSNLLLNNWITPVSFENKQGYLINTNEQRSFSPNYYNNPLWLLSLNKNKNSAHSFIAGIDANINISQDISMDAIVSYNKNKSTLNFALPLNTVGFKDGYLSKKQIENNTFNAYFNINYNDRIKKFAQVNIKSAIKYKYNTLDYNFLEQSGFQNFNFSNPLSEKNNIHRLNNTIIRLFNEIQLDFNTHFNADITLKNNTIFSDIQGHKIFLPSVRGYVDVVNMLGYVDWLNASLAFGYAKEANDMSLYYNNLSHNSLIIKPVESQSYLANNDLFNNKNLNLEISNTFDIESKISLFYNALTIGINYYHSKTKNSIFPIYHNGNFELQNIADIKSNGIELSLSSRIGKYNDEFKYIPTLLFSRNRSTVVNLHNGMRSIPIAGFSNVSKNLIVGEQTGSIVGSSLLRDVNGNVIIDDEGFPMVNPEKNIIGNTTPDFNLSFNNVFKLRKFQLDFLIDFQKGGDVWNGTQNVLNYFGRSQESATQRNITNYIFDGINTSGLVNTTKVDFANPDTNVNKNRWVRYGYDGVAEEAIVDGSYINLRSINLSYDFGKDSNKNFFKSLKVIFYAENLLLIAKNKGISPYSSLFGHSSSNGLNYFNMPIFREIGIKLNIKI